VPIRYANSYSYGNTIGDSDRDSDTYPNSHCDTNTTDNSYADANANRHANADCDSHRYTYRYAGRHHAQRAWLQSAGFADGGPLMGRRDLKQH
jgi:hypothetical protein